MKLGTLLATLALVGGLSVSEVLAHSGTEDLGVLIQDTPYATMQQVIESPTWRRWWRLPHAARHTLAGMKNGLVVDCGGGLSLYGMEVAGSGDVVVINVTRPDLYGRLIFPIADGKPVTFNVFHIDRVGSSIDEIGGLHAEALIGLGSTLGVPLPKIVKTLEPASHLHKMPRVMRIEETVTNTQVAQAFQSFFKAIAQKVRELMDAGHYSVVEEQVETYLAGVPNSSIEGTLLDIYGAFLWSEDRLGLLQTYYSRLAKGSSAIIEANLNDHVVTKKHRGKRTPKFTSMPLFESLADRNPEIFQNPNPRTLIMTRRKRVSIAPLFEGWTAVPKGHSEFWNHPGFEYRPFVD